MYSALRHLIDQDHHLTGVMRLLRGQGYGCIPVKRSGVRRVARRKTGEWRERRDQELTQRKDDELGWVIANIDDETLG